MIKKLSDLSSIPVDSIITWDTKDRGSYTYGTGRGTCYSMKKAIEMKKKDHMISCARSPKLLVKGEFPPFELSRAFDTLRYTVPAVSWKDYHEIKKFIDSSTRIIVEEYIKNNDDDLSFLLKLGQKRNWRDGCVLCLADHMMGTTCGCGHFEVVVFRPCGHAVCGQPCFKKLLETQGTQLQKKIYMVDGKEMVSVGTNGISLNYNRNDLNIDCPVCRIPISSTFDAGSV